MAKRTPTEEGGPVTGEPAVIGDQGDEHVVPIAVYPQHQHIPEFTAAELYLQDAIAHLVATAPRNDDGTLTVYPARNAWVDGWARRPQPVTEDQAVFLLAHVPPPFYLDESAAAAGGLLAERPPA